MKFVDDDDDELVRCNAHLVRTQIGNGMSADLSRGEMSRRTPGLPVHDYKSLHGRAVMIYDTQVNTQIHRDGFLTGCTISSAAG